MDHGCDHTTAQTCHGFVSVGKNLCPYRHMPGLSEGDDIPHESALSSVTKYTSFIEGLIKCTDVP